MEKIPAKNEEKCRPQMARGLAEAGAGREVVRETFRRPVETSELQTFQERQAGHWTQPQPAAFLQFRMGTIEMPRDFSSIRPVDSARDHASDQRHQKDDGPYNGPEIARMECQRNRREARDTPRQQDPTGYGKVSPFAGELFEDAGRSSGQGGFGGRHSRGDSGDRRLPAVAQKTFQAEEQGSQCPKRRAQIGFWSGQGERNGGGRIIGGKKLRRPGQPRIGGSRGISVGIGRAKCATRPAMRC